MFITAKDVFFLSDISAPWDTANSMTKRENVGKLATLKDRFTDATFYVGSLQEAKDSFGSEMYVFWFSSYEKFLLAKQFFLQKEEIYFAGFDSKLDGESPWFIMAPDKHFQDVEKWMEGQ